MACTRHPERRSPRVAASISVVIPTWREADRIAPTLAALDAQGPDEVIVADGGSPDGTADRAEAAPSRPRVLRTGRGRGVQLRAGAEAASGDVLLFLHADCRLEDGAIARLRDWSARHPRVPGGCFRMRVEPRGARLAIVEAAANLRAGLGGLPYGDQAMFARRWAYERAGGFPPWPLMEDVELVRRLGRLGRLAVLPDRVIVSARRWERTGVVRQTLRNWQLISLWALGVPAERLAPRYPTVR
jgi:rSAM/selenodomain-associated transferase 2